MKSKFILYSVLMLFGVSVYSQNKVQKTPYRPYLMGIYKVVFFSKDTKASCNFYSKYLGFSTSDSASKNPVIQINSKQFVQLIPEINTGGNRLKYFAIETSNAKALQKYLLSNKIAVSAITKEANGNKVFFVTDSNGVACQFIEHTNNTTISTENKQQDIAISNRMSHVGFMVADLDVAIRFYCGVLGFKEIWRGSKDKQNVTWVNLQLPDSKDYLELMLYNKQPSDEQMGVLNHICLEVDDVSKSFQLLHQRKSINNQSKVTTAIKTGINNKRQINCYDIDGTRVEIMEAQTIDGLPAPSSSAPPLKFVTQ